MKTWIKRTLAGLFGAAVLSTGLAACSGHGPHRPDWSAMSEADAATMKQRMVERATRYLDLDAAQQQRLGTLVDQMQASRKAVRGTSDPRTDLQSLVAGPAFDRAKALSLADTKMQAVNGQASGVINALADFYDGLRPEQQAKVRELMSRRPGRWH